MPGGGSRGYGRYRRYRRYGRYRRYRRYRRRVSRVRPRSVSLGSPSRTPPCRYRRYRRYRPYRRYRRAPPCRPQAINPLHGGPFGAREISLCRYLQMPISAALLNTRLAHQLRSAVDRNESLVRYMRCIHALHASHAYTRLVRCARCPRYMRYMRCMRYIHPSTVTSRWCTSPVQTTRHTREDATHATIASNTSHTRSHVTLRT